MGMGTVGLSILLETHHRHHHHSMNTNTQILNKFSLPKPPSSSTYSSPLPSPTFLDSCFLCKKSLPPGKDIYMYRGDRAFCSVECRCRQIFIDESRENTISSSSSPHSRERRKRSGGVAF